MLKAVPKRPKSTPRSPNKVMTRRLAAIALLSVLFVGVFQIPAQAQTCAMCRSSIENSPDMKALAPNINRGILFLMGVPYVLFGTIGFVVYRGYRKKKAAERRSANPYIPRN